MNKTNNTYYRLEVITQTSSGGYDLMGLTKQQVIDDVLEQYEAYLTFLSPPASGGDDFIMFIELLIMS